MLKKLNKHKFRISLLFLSLFGLIFIRSFESQLFYDPFLAFFKLEYQNKSLPEFDGISLFFGVYEMLLLPVALVAVYICIYRPVFYTLILCFLIPFSLFVDDVGGGFGLSLPTEPMIWLLFLVYVIQLSFSPNDVGAIEDGQNLNVIRDAIVFYRPNKHWNIGFGQTKLPGNRQRVNSSGALQLTDRSINNARFNIDRDFGLQVYYLNESKNTFSYNIKTAISTGEGRNWTREPDNGLAYTGKLELFPLGVFKNDGTLYEGDIKRESTPKVMLSGSFHFNEKARRTQGTLGNNLFESRDMTSILLDAMFKYKGLSFQTSYMERSAKDPITVNPNNINETQFVFVGNGFDTQLSYIFDNNYEVITRFSHQKPFQSIENLTPKSNQYTLGITKYIWEHAFKIQAELTKTNLNFFNNTKQENWYLRFQVEIGI